MSGNVPRSYPTRRLPKQPSLEQLRKQAKDLLAQYRAGDPSAVAEVQQFERRPDPATFALNDAQRVLARAYGYESWPKLKAFVDGANVAKLADAVRAGDAAHVRVLLHARPELVNMDMAENDEHRALHYAVLGRDAAMVKLLMEAGADAHKGIFPHRDATSALAMARDRGYRGHRGSHRGRGAIAARGDELPQRLDFSRARRNQLTPSGRATTPRRSVCCRVMGR